MSCLRLRAQHLLILRTLTIQGCSASPSPVLPRGPAQRPLLSGLFLPTLSSSGSADSAPEASAGTAQSRETAQTTEWQRQDRMAEAGKLRVAGHAVSSASQPRFDSWRCSWSVFKQPGQEGKREEEKAGQAGRGWGWIRARGCEKQEKSSRRSLLWEESQRARSLHRQGSQIWGRELGRRLLLSAKGPESWGLNPEGWDHDHWGLYKDRTLEGASCCWFPGSCCASLLQLRTAVKQGSQQQKWKHFLPTQVEGRNPQPFPHTPCNYKNDLLEILHRHSDIPLPQASPESTGNKYESWWRIHFRINILG